jgi:hypothetical protein
MKNRIIKNMCQVRRRSFHTILSSMILCTDPDLKHECLYR